MFNCKFLVILLISILVSISAVSAADTSNTLNSDDNNLIIESVNVEENTDIDLSNNGSNNGDKMKLINNESSLEPKKDSIEVKEVSNSNNPGYLYLRQIKDYLFEVYYDEYPCTLEEAEEMFENMSFTESFNFACSGVRKDNLFGRNLDWDYCDSATFLIKTTATDDRYAVIGIGMAIDPEIGTLTEKFVQSGQYCDGYKLLPYALLDGMNDKGVVCSINIVPEGDKEGTYLITPAIEKRATLSNQLLPRFILDNFDNAKDAVEYIRDYIEVTQNLGLYIHLLVCDDENSFIIEFYDGKTIIKNATDNPYMTNFYVSDIILNEDGSVITPETSVGNKTPVKVNNITPHGEGLERYNIINERYDSINSKDDLRELLKDLYFTNLGKNTTNPYWYSEIVFNGYGFDLNLESSMDEFNYFKEYMEELYKSRTRDGKTWFTSHSSIYDLNTLTLYLVTQEEEGEYVFTFDMPKILNLSIEINHSKYGENIKGTINKNLNGNISAIINNHIYKGRVTNGNFILNGTDKLVPGTYSAYFTFISDDDEYAGATTVDINITKGNSTPDDNITNKTNKKGIPMEHTGIQVFTILLVLFLPILRFRKNE